VKRDKCQGSPKLLLPFLNLFYASQDTVVFAADFASGNNSKHCKLKPAFGTSFTRKVAISEFFYHGRRESLIKMGISAISSPSQPDSRGPTKNAFMRLFLLFTFALRIASGGRRQILAHKK
jgi:hypothetical protein